DQAILPPDLLKVRRQVTQSPENPPRFPAMNQMLRASRHDRTNPRFNQLHHSANRDHAANEGRIVRSDFLPALIPARNPNDRRTCQKKQVPQQSFFMHSFPPRDAPRFPPSGASMRRFEIHAIVSACVVTNAAVRHSTAAPMNASRIRTLDETGGLP
ncbi:hypothetical protein, partial [Burkholderia ubonensis]